MNCIYLMLKCQKISGDYICLISLMCVLFSGKVFSKLNYTVPKGTIKEVAECKPRVIEVVLANLRMKVSRFMNFFDQAS